MPGEWIDEMQGDRAGAYSRGGDGHGRQNERMRDVVDADERRNNRQRFGTKSAAAEDGEEEVYQIPYLRFCITLVLAVICTALTLHYGKFKIKSQAKPKLRPISTFGVLDGNISLVYEYLSTADYRTEWHMAAIEVSGPAIDHSAVPGEFFTEELSIDEKDVLVRWDVLERQVPSTKDAQTAEFVLDGVAEVSGKVKENWKETFRLRAGLHHFAKTPQVNVELELLLVDDDGETPFTKKQKRWRKALLTSLKESLAMMRMRVDELSALQRKSDEQRLQRKSEEQRKKK